MDYSKPLREVYLDILKVCLSEPMHELDFLGHTMKMRRPDSKPTHEADWLTWPSWVPNWDQPVTFKPLPKRLYVRVKAGVDLIKKIKGRFRPEVLYNEVNAYNASRWSRVEAYISGDRLVVKGVRCDIIQDIIALHGREVTTEANRGKGKIWEAAANYKYFTGEEWAVAMKRACALDINRSSGRPCGRNFTYDKNAIRSPFEAKLISEYETRMAAVSTTGSVFPMRNICLTEKGYIGIVPETTEVGDIVCVLLGGQVLYTLRYPGAGDEYEYIGEAYIHGLMDGVVMKWVANGAAPVETFILS